MTSLRFREDGSFRVLQMADVQDGPDVLPDTIRLIREDVWKVSFQSLDTMFPGY